MSDNQMNKELNQMNGSIRRVAAYICVSTYADEPNRFLETQRNYYADYIKNQPGWVMADVYVDEGISGVQRKRREGLEKLLADCRDGKIDYIITKSISRLTNDTDECLSIIDELRNLNPPVGIIFENEHIDTLNEESDKVLQLCVVLIKEAVDEAKRSLLDWSDPPERFYRVSKNQRSKRKMTT